jgi:hypothetical protein
MRLKVFKINQYILSMCADGFDNFLAAWLWQKYKLNLRLASMKTLSNSEGP